MLRYLMIISLLLLHFTVFAKQNELFLKYDSLKTFSADFDQYYTSRLTKKVSQESGKIIYMAPSFMKFQTFKKNKKKTETYVRDNKVAFLNYEKKTVLEKKGQGDYAQYLVFLKGVKEIKKTFTVKLGNKKIAQKVGIKMKDDEKIYKLTPKKALKNVRYIFLIMNDGDVNSVVIIDEMKNINQLVFKNKKNNPSVNKSVFNYQVPSGFEISKF